jgi:hypothetical protein
MRVPASALNRARVAVARRVAWLMREVRRVRRAQIRIGEREARLAELASELENLTTSTR